MKKICLFLLGLTLIASPALALKTIDDFSDTNPREMGRKLKRGALNVVTSPLEIPKQIQAEVSKTEKTAPKVISVLGGGFKGIASMTGRFASGLWDVATFNLSVPDNYGSFVKPEYICPHMSKDAATTTK